MIKKIIAISLLILALIGIYNVFHPVKKYTLLRCSELTQKEAIKAFENGATYLDRNKNGEPCE